MHLSVFFKILANYTRQNNTRAHIMSPFITTLITLSAFLILLLCSLNAIKTIRRQEKNNQKQSEQILVILERLNHLQQQKDDIQNLLRFQQEDSKTQREKFDQHQITSLTTIQESLQKGLGDARQQITTTLHQHNEHTSKRIEALTQETRSQLRQISGEVDKQLEKGFEKTTATFTDVMKRLTIIDQAQQKITELSTNVVSLQEILSDKKSRGAFGEVQLNQLIRNIIPEAHFSLQHTLSNGKRCDCLLFLPEPTGNIVIDAKFPLESFQQSQSSSISPAEKNAHLQQFKQDIKKHIQDIAKKYIIPNETSDSAIMFIPAESIFAEIHGHHPDLVEFSQQSKVWLTSPTTLMAVLTTSRAVLKDAATRKQIHIIQQHLVALSSDFIRFQKRMDDVAKHVNKAQQDVEQVHRSSKKISQRFAKIEQVELTDSPSAPSISVDE